MCKVLDKDTIEKEIVIHLSLPICGFDPTLLLLRNPIRSSPSRNQGCNGYNCHGSAILSCHRAQLQYHGRKQERVWIFEIHCSDSGYLNQLVVVKTSPVIPGQWTQPKPVQTINIQLTRSNS